MSPVNSQCRCQKTFKGGIVCQRVRVGEVILVVVINILFCGQLEHTK